jgi:hypothetical protein
MGLIQNPEAATATISVANRVAMHAVHRGLVEATIYDDTCKQLRINFTDAFSVHGLESPLISVRSLAAQGCTIVFHINGGTIVTASKPRSSGITFGIDHKIKCVMHVPLNAKGPSIHKALSASISEES